jgi:hypothetical protein
VGESLLIVGVAILVISLFVGWYAVSETGTATETRGTVTVQGTATFYLLDQYVTSLTCTGNGGCFPNTSTTDSYSQGAFTSVGTLYDVEAIMVIGSILLGALGAFLAFFVRGGRSNWTAALVLTAAILAFLAPALLVGAQPSVLASQTTAQTGSGPWSSFVGSCSGGGCGQSLPVGLPSSGSWAPAIGWFLSFLAGVALLIGFVVIRGRRRGYSGGPVLEFSR